MSNTVVYINGKYFEKENAKVSVFDHGFLYGDGVFESIKCYKGNVFALIEHVARLFDSMKAINLEIPETPEKISKLVCQTVQKTGLQDAYIRLVVSRGVGDLGLDPRKCPAPSIIIIAQENKSMFGDLYDKGIKVFTVGVRRIAPDAIDVRAKTLNYLNNILAKIQANAAGHDEALLLNHLGYVCEGTGDNIFIIKKRRLFTPPTESGALQGITRKFVLQLSEKIKLSYEETNLTLIDVYTSDEVFMTGTLADIVPVIEVDGRIIGDGKPGLLTKSLIGQFVKTRSKYGVKLY